MMCSFTKIEMVMYMNIQELDLINALAQEPFVNQRALSESSGHSLGVVNRSLRTLAAEGYLDDAYALTEKSREMLRQRAPKNAVILAAGYGMRMVPINTETPKGLLEIQGEPLIERLIRQLREVGIQEIYVVVGFMKEHYEYLIDEYGVTLLVNDQYAQRNNLYSLYLAEEYLSNTYVVPCEVWCRENPFRQRELYSWYMVSDGADGDSTLRVSRKLELMMVARGEGGSHMIGVCYLLDRDAQRLRERMKELCRLPQYDHAFWEEALMGKDRMSIPARVVPAAQAVEINTYEQLRELDSGSNQLKTSAIETIAQALQVDSLEVTEITLLKKGMTNRSFSFTCRQQRYIMRIPGEGTDWLINRAQEAAVYRTIGAMDICDDVVYINPDNGYKITKMLPQARTCDPENWEEIRLCMEKLRAFHNKKLRVDHSFDLFPQISFYESLWGGAPSAYKDYQETKEKVLSLQSYLKRHEMEPVLCHIDAVPDNFLFSPGPDGRERLYMIDWEYAGMHDPHIDVAMFCIYAMSDRPQVDRLIDTYFPEGCSREIRIKIYCYISACGLLWSNWCEYKRSLGVEFGAYSLCQYRYAKDYYKIVQKELGGQL